MLKRHCDNCKKVIEAESITIEYRNRKNYEHYTCDLCVQCLGSVEKMSDIKRLAESKKKEV